MQGQYHATNWEQENKNQNNKCNSLTFLFLFIRVKRFWYSNIFKFTGKWFIPGGDTDWFFIEIPWNRSFFMNGITGWTVPLKLLNLTLPPSKRWKTIPTNIHFVVHASFIDLNNFVNYIYIVLYEVNFIFRLDSSHSAT